MDGGPMNADLGQSATSGYGPFDQREKLGEPPWSGAALEAWEKAHGHDARLKCYPEFGCQVVEAGRERLEEAARRVVDCYDEARASSDINTAWGILAQAINDLRETLDV
jgi:hypothetical protein